MSDEKPKIKKDWSLECDNCSDGKPGHIFKCEGKEIVDGKEYWDEKCVDCGKRVLLPIN